MNFAQTQKKQISDLAGYKTFAKQLEYQRSFFENLSDLIFSNGQTISFMTGKKMHFLNTSLIDSAAKSLKSITFCCSQGSFSDANTLVRKLRDDLLLYVFLLDIINRRKPFLEDSLRDADFSNIEGFTKSLEQLRFNEVLSDDEQAIDAWFSNTVDHIPTKIKRKLSYANYMVVLKSNENIRDILKEYGLGNYWEKLSGRLNDFVHNNGEQFTLYNSSSAEDSNIASHLENIQYRVTYISSFFLVLLLMVRSSLISSSDYIDHLDAGMQPPEECQYLVAPFIQEFIDKELTRLHPELKKYLKDNNNHGMKID